MAKKIIPQSAENSTPLFPESELVSSEVREFKLSNGIRGVVLNGETFISIIDTYRAEGIKNAPREWAKDLEKLRLQTGDTESVLPVYQFTVNGQRQKATHIVNKEQLARVAQIANIPHWEPIRQEMVDLFMAKRRQPVPVEQSKEYRAHLEAGYDKAEAKKAIETRQEEKQTQKELTSEWQKRGIKSGQEYAQLNNDVTKAALGVTATQLKREMQVDNPRDYLSHVENGVIAFTQKFATLFHRDRDSQGIGELESDISDAGELINKDALNKAMSKTRLKLPAPKPEQKRLMGGK
jgi:hypothetical protein